MRVAICALIVLISPTGLVSAEPASLVKAIPLLGTSTGQSSALAQHPGPRDIDTIIRNWHRAKSNVERFDADFDRIDRDSVFEVTQLSHGSLAIDTKGRGFLKCARRQIPAKTVHSGYRAVSGEDMHWRWTERAIWHIDDRQRQYEELSLPPEDNGLPPFSSRRQRFIPDPDRPEPPALPVDASPNQFAEFFVRLFTPRLFVPPEIVLRTSQADLFNEFDIQLVKLAEDGIYLDLSPRTSTSCYTFHFSLLRILLSHDSYELKAVKFVDARGSRTQTFVFTQRHFNQPANHIFPDLGARPDLSNYKQIVEPFLATSRTAPDRKK